MGSWGITMRQSDYGLDLLGTIVDTQLKAADFATFNVAEAIDLLRQDIPEEIKRANRGCPLEEAAPPPARKLWRSCLSGILLSPCRSTATPTGPRM